MGNITQNFSFYEFRPHDKSKSWLPDNDYQEFLLRILATNLQVVRDKIPDGSYMKITSGVRTPSDYDRLILSGYRPSSTSDHYCGTAINILDYRKRKKFGSTYNFSVGAADVQPVGITARQLFNLSFRLVKEQMCDFGQVIYEKNPSTGAEWVHYGNSLKKLFSEKIISMIGRIQFMQSIDGGLTYTQVLSTI